MSIFYENYVKLCNGKGKSPSGVALEIGLSKTAVNGWKHGRSNPTDATAQKVAEYFGITVEELLGENEQKEKPAIQEDDRLKQVADDIRGLSDKDFEDLQRYLRFLKSSDGQ